MKRIALFLMAIVLLLPLGAAATEDISARSAVLTDGASGRLLYEKNGFERLSMASTTKIMTAILAIEGCNMDDVVTISPTASGVEGSSLWLEIGERLTVRQLLYGLMLKSGNDAAVALAEQTAGNVDAFVAMMNAKAHEIGMFNTHFETPNGLDSDAHYTTAYDMALLAGYAMKNNTFRTIAGTKETSVPWQGRDWDRALKNHNKLLWSYEGCTGVKTGFTKKSGRCLVSAAKRDGRELIAVTLNAPDDWNDHKKMLDHGFEAFETARLAEKNKLWERLSVEEKELGAICEGDFVTSLCPHERESIEYRAEYGSLTLPIEKGQTLGRLYIFSEGEFLGAVGLVADSSLYRDGYRDYLIKITKGLM